MLGPPETPKFAGGGMVVFTIRNKPKVDTMLPFQPLIRGGGVTNTLPCNPLIRGSG